MATSKEGINLPDSPVRPKRQVQRPRYLEDYLVGQHSLAQMHRHEEERELLSQTPVWLYPDRAGEPQPSPVHATHPHRTEDHPSIAAELTHQLEQLTIPPPLSRVTQPPQHTLDPRYGIQAIRQETEHDTAAHLHTYFFIYLFIRASTSAPDYQWDLRTRGVYFPNRLFK